MPSIGSSVGEGRGRAQRARVWGWVLVCSQMCEFPRPEQACNCSTSPIYTHADTTQRVKDWWGRGGVHSSWDGVSTCVPGVRVVPSGDPPPTSLCNLCSHQPILPYLLHTRQYTDTPQRVRGWWNRGGFTVHGTGFRPASLESGLFLKGTPRRLHCVTFAPTSQFSPYLLHTRQYTDRVNPSVRASKVRGRVGAHARIGSDRWGRCMARLSVHASEVRGRVHTRASEVTGGVGAWPG